VRQAERRLSIDRRKWALRFFLLQVGGKRVKRDSCILQRKRVLQWLQEGGRRWKTGQAGPTQVLQEGTRQVKEVTWSLGSLQVGQTSLSVSGVAVDGRSIMSGMHGGMQLFSGRSGTQSVDDLGNRLEAAYAKARSKDKKLTRAEFLHQLAGYLECEALRIWRKHRGDILEPRGVAEGVVCDPIEEVVKLFKKESGAASAEQVQELQNLIRREGETCRMLKARLEQLSEETGLFNEQERAVAFVGALPDALRLQVEPLVWLQSEGGVYSLEKAFQVAERMDLAKAFACARAGAESSSWRWWRQPLGRASSPTQLTGPRLHATAVGSMDTRRTRVPCREQW
jgi:hypothetical protein